MKLPKVSAVLAAAALAPTVLFPSMASAAERPAPAGVSGPDTASDAMGDHDSQEALDRAEVQRILADKESGRGVREAAEKALAGSAADLRHFLTVELDKQRWADRRVKVAQFLNSGGPAIRKAVRAALMGTDEDILKFLKEGQYIARAEDEDRAEVQRILADKDSGYAVRAAAQKVVNGTAAELRVFLEVGLADARVTDNRIRVAQIFDGAGRAVRKAADDALRINTPEALLKFLNEGQHKARAEDDRVEILTLLADKEIGPSVYEGAQKALDGKPADLRRFLEVGLADAREIDNRVKAVQVMAIGGPAVKKAAVAALKGTAQDVLAFLKEGQYKARAEDEANAAAAAKPTTPVQQPDQAQNTGTGQSQSSGQTVQPVSAVSTNTNTNPAPAVAPAQVPVTTPAAPTSDRLAATGADEGLGWEAGVAAAAVVAGAALVAVSRRRHAAES
ncbi:ALF repeat-containing protein [Kitasatospora sp. NPDC050543]|uniref:ALF repeat-containing protein n=1 Tax=Kitasatospora sp. NPDC050543 TaxID=3364054 RepID=UPI00379AA916